MCDYSITHFNSVDYDDNITFVVQMNENGDVKIGIMKNCKYIELPYNMGLPKATLKYKYCNNVEEENIVIGFKSLLDYSFGTLGKTRNEIDQVKSNFFEVNRIFLIDS
jgi:hypothetical protein